MPPGDRGGWVEAPGRRCRSGRRWQRRRSVLVRLINVRALSSNSAASRERSGQGVRALVARSTSAPAAAAPSTWLQAEQRRGAVLVRLIRVRAFFNNSRAERVDVAVLTGDVQRRRTVLQRPIDLRALSTTARRRRGLHGTLPAAASDRSPAPGRPPRRCPATAARVDVAVPGRRCTAAAPFHCHFSTTRRPPRHAPTKAEPRPRGRSGRRCTARRPVLHRPVDLLAFLQQQRRTSVACRRRGAAASGHDIRAIDVRAFI